MKRNLNLYVVRHNSKINGNDTKFEDEDGFFSQKL